MTKTLAKTLTLILFVGVAALGSWVAFNRCLWNDEYYSLMSSTLGSSYQSTLLGGVKEGNNSPLFYFLQKLQCDLFSYYPPWEWAIDDWGGTHYFDQLFLRVQSVVFMSAGLSALFYYFCRRNSWVVGAYALALTMTSSLFWFHWTEARPYAALIALSFFQILVLLHILENPIDLNKESWVCLIIIHCLLALTSSVSLIQIMAAGVVLWVFHRPRFFWSVFIILIPMGICCFYYFRAPHYKFFFVEGPAALINANIPKDRLFIIFMPAFLLFFRSLGQRWKEYVENKYLVFFILTLGAFGVVLLKMKCDQTGTLEGFQISSRYFLPLLPMGIIGVVLFSVYFIKAFPSKAWKAAAIIFLAGLFIFRSHKTVMYGLNDLKILFSREKSVVK